MLRQSNTLHILHGPPIKNNAFCPIKDFIFSQLFDKMELVHQ